MLPCYLINLSEQGHRDHTIVRKVQSPFEDYALPGVGLIGMVSLEFNGLGADEIKRHPEVEVLLITPDNRTEVMRKILNWLMEE